MIWSRQMIEHLTTSPVPDQSRRDAPGKECRGRPWVRWSLGSEGEAGGEVQPPESDVFQYVVIADAAETGIGQADIRPELPFGGNPRVQRDGV